MFNKTFHLIFANIGIIIIKNKFPPVQSCIIVTARGRVYLYTCSGQGRLNAWARWAVSRGPTSIGAPMLIYVYCDLLLIKILLCNLIINMARAVIARTVVVETISQT